MGELTPEFSSIEEWLGEQINIVFNATTGEYEGMVRPSTVCQGSTGRLTLRPGIALEHSNFEGMNRPACCTIDHTETVERYLKALFENSKDGTTAGTSDLARTLGVAAPSVTAMLHRLRDCALVEPTEWGQVMLTPHGRRHAHGIVRRHRLLETFLHDVLGVRWDEVHVEAEKLEHGLSERVEDLIDIALDHPRHDPHGDPIPAKDGAHDEGAELALEWARPGDRFRVLRVNDRYPGALRALTAMEVGLGAEFEILAAAPGAVRVRQGTRYLVLPAEVMRAVRGELLAEAAS